MPQPRRSASTAADTRRRLLAAVHILAKEAGLSRDIYEAAIDGVHPGVASAADLTNKELHEMCRRFSSKKAAQAQAQAQAQAESAARQKGFWVVVSARQRGYYPRAQPLSAPKICCSANPNQRPRMVV